MTGTKERAGGLSVKTMCQVAIMTALCCILGPLSIPIGPVPVSLTMVAVFLSVYVLDTVWGTLAYVLYLLVGLAGLPVFSGFTGGVAKLFGPTGGYLAGMIFMALITGMFLSLSERTDKRVLRIGIQFFGMVLGAVVNYVLGTVYFMLIMHVTFKEGLFTCVIPFVAVDLIKILLCILVGNTLRKALRLANLRT